MDNGQTNISLQALLKALQNDPAKVFGFSVRQQQQAQEPRTGELANACDVQFPQVQAVREWAHELRLQQNEQPMVDVVEEEPTTPLPAYTQLRRSPTTLLPFWSPAQTQRVVFLMKNWVKFKFNLLLQNRSLPPPPPPRSVREMTAVPVALLICLVVIHCCGVIHWRMLRMFPRKLLSALQRLQQFFLLRTPFKQETMKSPPSLARNF